MEDKRVFRLVRSAYRVLALHPSSNTIFELDEDVVEKDEYVEDRYKFWKQVLVYSLYCYNASVATLISNMMVTVFFDRLKAEYPSINASLDVEYFRLSLESALREEIVGKFEADLISGL